MDETARDSYLKIDGPQSGGIPSAELAINIGGPSGESIFSRPLEWCMKANTLKILQKELNEQFVHVRDANDDRLLALVGALVVENAIDRLLSAVLPGYRTLRDGMQLTFSMRIKIAKAARLMPSRILGCADFVRAVRNDFAHDLEIGSFDQLDSSKLQSMRDRLSHYSPDLIAAKSHAQVFEGVVTWTAIGLHLYALHVATLGDFLRSDEFLTCLKHSVAKEG